jgi:hypothetical protein
MSARREINSVARSGSIASSFSEPRVDLRGSAFVKLKTPQSATLRCVVQVSRERITGAD